jgi:PTS system nitrogen regulatory IIA component
MIDIGSLIDPQAIVTGLEAGSKEEVIRLLVERLLKVRARKGPVPDMDAVLEEVLSREAVQTTGLGNGLAFPHARIEGWGAFGIAIGVLRSAVEFNSVDGQPVRIICLFVSDILEPYIILQSMSAFVRFLSQPEHVDGLLDPAITPDDIAARFRRSRVNSSELIYAGDIARPVEHTVDLATPIEEVTRIMHLNQLDILPVVDDHNRLCGEVSCLEVFRYGLPDFFNQLNTISFVRHIDPFEKYFRIKRNLTVRDLYNPDPAVLTRDRTLVEIIFELTVKGRSKLFVVAADKTLIGSIDRFTVIDKILFF